MIGRLMKFLIGDPRECTCLVLRAQTRAMLYSSIMLMNRRSTTPSMMPCLGLANHLPSTNRIWTLVRLRPNGSWRSSSDRPLQQVPRHQPAQGLAGVESSPSPKSTASHAHTVVVECCRGEQSRISSATQRSGTTTLRMTKAAHELSTSAGLRNAKREILGLVADKHQSHLWASLPCKPWSRWNECNRWKYGRKFRA